MKTSFIYYSLEGNMDYIAKEVADNLDIKLCRLTLEKDYPKGKFGKYFWGGKSATFGERPKLSSIITGLSECDTLILGTPVWAGTCTPPMNTFLHDYPVSGKNIILVATHAGGGTDKCFSKMKEVLSENKIIHTFDFVNPLTTHNDRTAEKILEIRNLIV